MDRRLYAIKAAKREARGQSDRDRMLREVYALAALSDDTSSGTSGSSSDSAEAMRHVVRYYQAWMEGSRLYIQIELCQCTLLDEMVGGALAAGREGGGRRRYKLLREMCLALNLIHKSGMIHLDIKVGLEDPASSLGRLAEVIDLLSPLGLPFRYCTQPENIFIKNDQYKLGDFGLVSNIENHGDVEEGDSRYMSRELLSGDLDDLTKVSYAPLVGPTDVLLGRRKNS